MTTEERLAAIEKKLDLLLNTVGIKESMLRERTHERQVIMDMNPADLKAYMQRKLREAKRRHP